MKEYLGIEGYAAFLDCIKEHIGPGLYGNGRTTRIMIMVVTAANESFILFLF